jgi:hypothetical protein
MIQLLIDDIDNLLAAICTVVSVCFDATMWFDDVTGYKFLFSKTRAATSAPGRVALFSQE